MGLIAESMTVVNVSFIPSIPLVSISSSWFFILVIILLFICLFIALFLRKKSSHSITKHTITIKTGLVDFCSTVDKSMQNIYIANRIYIELITRKAALNVDLEHDVIIEIYNSWYTLFGIIREEIKNIPSEQLVNEKSTKLIEITIKILNEGLRPHLTTYQARFRKWYLAELDKDKTSSPQEIQVRYPDYNELSLSIKEVNELLKQFSNGLHELIYGKK